MSEKTEHLLYFEEQKTIFIGTIRFTCVLSAANVAEFGLEALKFVNAHPGLNLLLNFEKVDYLSSAVLTELLRIKKAIDDTNGRLRLCSISKTIQEVFEITNLDQVFVLDSADVDTAKNRFLRTIEVAAKEDAWKAPGS